MLSHHRFDTFRSSGVNTVSATLTYIYIYIYIFIYIFDGFKVVFIGVTCFSGDVCKDPYKQPLTKQRQKLATRRVRKNRNTLLLHVICNVARYSQELDPDGTRGSFVLPLPFLGRRRRASHSEQFKIREATAGVEIDSKYAAK